MKKTIGILGGMGPLATCDLMTQIVRNTKAGKDQDYPRILVDNNTNIPDRTKAILFGGEDPVPQMADSARKLQNIGADFLIVPCNTAHYFLDRVRACVDVPFLNMIEETVEEAVRRGIKTVGLLGTSGTLRTGLYTKMFEARGIRVVAPDEARQQSVDSVIYDCVKAARYDYDVSGFMSTLQNMQEEGAEVFILGCTELPIFWEKFQVAYPAINPTLCLARKAIQAAGYETV